MLSTTTTSHFFTTPTLSDSSQLDYKTIPKYQNRNPRYSKLDLSEILWGLEVSAEIALTESQPYGDWSIA